jgi:sRNA-binding protein
VDLRAEIAAALKQERVKIARLGGLARAKSLTAKQRKDSASKASKAAAKARKRKAKARWAKQKRKASDWST